MDQTMIIWCDCFVPMPSVLYFDIDLNKKMTQTHRIAIYLLHTQGFLEQKSGMWRVLTDQYLNETLLVSQSLQLVRSLWLGFWYLSIAGHIGWMSKCSVYLDSLCVTLKDKWSGWFLICFTIGWKWKTACYSYMCTFRAFYCADQDYINTVGLHSGFIIWCIFCLIIVCNRRYLGWFFKHIATTKYLFFICGLIESYILKLSFITR